MIRPYDDYVRASDLIEVGLITGGAASGWWTPGPEILLSGFPVSHFGNALQNHGLLLLTVDQSEWSRFVGGAIIFRVGPVSDFAHLRDVADAAAQAAQDVGFYTSDQEAHFIIKVPDDITYEETTRFGSAAQQIDWSQSRDTAADRIRNLPQDVSAGLEQTINDASESFADWWNSDRPGNAGFGFGTVLIAGVLLLIVASGGKRRR